MNMAESIIVAIITGGLSLVGTVFTILATSRKTEENIKISQAVMNKEIEELTREVRLHNNFATRIPVMEEQIKEIKHKIADLEGDT